MLSQSLIQMPVQLSPFPCSAEVEDTTEDPVIIINPYVKDRESGLRLSKLLAKNDNEDLKMALVWGEANKILINLPSTVLSVSRSIDSNILSEEIALMETGKYKEALEKLNGRYGNLVPDSFVTGRVDELVLECMIAIEMGLNEKCIHSHTSNGGVVVKACTCRCRKPHRRGSCPASPRASPGRA